MGIDSLMVQQEKAKRIACAAAYFSTVIFQQRVLNMSAVEFYEAALIYRTVHVENQGIYDGTYMFNDIINSMRSAYSIKVAKERGVKLTDAQKRAIVGGNSLEAAILRLAETFICLQYRRKRNFKEVDPVKSYEELKAELVKDPMIGRDLLLIIGDAKLHQFYEHEEIIRINWEADLAKF